VDKKELLEKLYDKYQMEIARKDRIESKSIGYYTIIGIFFAAFLVIEPLLFSRNILVKFSLTEVLAIINYFLIISYIIIFLIAIIKLHNNYKPKIRPEFDPIENWDTLIIKDDDESTELIKNELIKIIKYYEEKNAIFVKRLSFVNLLCIINAIIIVAIFVVLVTTYLI
jgi:hypothetical protein